MLNSAHSNRFWRIGHNYDRDYSLRCIHNVAAHNALSEVGYTGIIGMEHGLSLPGKEGEAALIEAYAKVDDFD